MNHEINIMETFYEKKTIWNCHHLSQGNPWTTQKSSTQQQIKNPKLIHHNITTGTPKTPTEVIPHKSWNQPNLAKNHSATTTSLHQENQYRIGDCFFFFFFFLGFGNKIFWYQIIPIYRFRITTIYIYLFVYENMKIWIY